MPWNFQLHMQFSLTTLMPEPVYVSGYLCTSILLCWFVSDAYSKRTAVALGVATGATIWSRWNAVVNLALPIAGFGFVCTIRLIFLKERLTRPVLINCAIAALVVIAFAAVYSGFEYQPILEYGLQVSISTSFDWPTKIAGSEWLLLNVPGLAIAGQWFPPNTAVTPAYAIVLTVLGHAIVLSSAVTGVRRALSHQKHEILIGTLGLIGAAIFYLDILLAISTFSGFYSRVNTGSCISSSPRL